jgi:AcrR family transcriptional regulator
MTRSRILDHAVVLASRWGFEGLSLGLLAGSLGLSKSGLYAHFRSKEALVLAVLDRTAEKHVAHSAPYLAGKEAGLSRLSAYLFSWLDWLALPELPAGCPILGAAFEFEETEGIARDRLFEILQSMSKMVEELLRQSIMQGHLRADLPIAQVVFELRSVALGYHLEARFMKSPNARLLANEAIAAILKRYVIAPDASK